MVVFGKLSGVAGFSDVAVQGAWLVLSAAGICLNAVDNQTRSYSNFLV